MKEFPDCFFENRSRFLVGRTCSVLSLGIRVSVSILCTVSLSILNGVPTSLSNLMSVSISCTVCLFLSNGISLSSTYLSINLSVCVYTIYCVSISIEWNVSTKDHVSLSIRESLSISCTVSLSLSLSSAYVSIKSRVSIYITYCVSVSIE